MTPLDNDPAGAAEGMVSACLGVLVRVAAMAIDKGERLQC